MSERPEIVPVCGWRVDDAREIVALHNLVASRIARSDLPEHVIVRRLRLISAMLAATANTVFERDPWQEGMDIADDFFRRRREGQRGEHA